MMMTLFPNKVMPVPHSGCWVWMGAPDHHGYGRARHEGREWYAHRLSYHLARGLPEDMCVLHKCDVRSCVNPDHLFLGTRPDNSRDMVAKDRQGKGEGSGSKLTETIVRQIRADTRFARIAAPFYGIAPSHVTRIRNRQSWKHLP